MATPTPFLAVDPNARAGACLWMGRGWTPRVRTFAVRGNEARAVADVCAEAYRLDVAEAVIEQVPIFGRHGAGAKQLVTMGVNCGRWIQACEERGMHVTLVPARTWQAAMGAMAHRGETEADRDRRRILLATAILRDENGTAMGGPLLTVDAACAVLLGAYWERARLIGGAA